MDRFILELIFLSEKRKDILLFLKDGPKTTAQIKEYLNLSYVAVLPQLKKSRDNFLILKTEDAYSLSPLGIAIASRMKAMVDLLNLFGTQYDYWAIHSLVHRFHFISINFCNIMNII
jgi:predicted transcriptional regulator